MLLKFPIQVPNELAPLAMSRRALVKTYETNRWLKPLGVWLVLKAITTSGKIENWNGQLDYLQQVTGCRGSALHSRLKFLQDLELVLVQDGNIYLASWLDAGKILNIDISHRTKIEYDANEGKAPHLWIVATDIEVNQSRQAYKVLQKLDKNPDHKIRLLQAVINNGGDRTRLKDPVYLLARLTVLYQQSFYRVSDIHQLLILYRPLLDRGCRGIAKAWNAKSPSIASYQKSRLEKAGVIAVSKLQIQSIDRARNQFCQVRWLKAPKQTLLCLVDAITVLKPWTIQGTLNTANTENTNSLHRRLSAC